MMYPIVLALHITAACITAALAAYALYAVWKNKTTIYRALAIVLACIAAFEIISGVGLILLSPLYDPASFVLHMLEYLAVCAVVEALLFVRIQKMAAWTS